MYFLDKWGGAQAPSIDDGMYQNDVSINNTVLRFAAPFSVWHVCECLSPSTH